MKQPKWQRARATKAAGSDAGREMWVRIARPITIAHALISTATGLPCTNNPSLETNIIDPWNSNNRVWINASRTELLARDENDFADDVPLISWQDFIAQQPTKEDR